MKVSKYLSVNSQVLVLITLIVLILVSFIVFFGLHKSILTEFTYVLAILAVSLFLFLFIGLYNGLVIGKENTPKDELDKLRMPNTIDFSKKLDQIDWLAWVLSSEYYPLPYIILFIVMLLIGLALTGFYIVALLVLAFYWLFYWAYRVVFRHSKASKGDVAKSLLYSLSYTILYSGWFFILIQAIKYFKQ